MGLNKFYYSMLFVVATFLLGVQAARGGDALKVPNAASGSPKKFMVGGTDGWVFGVNYTEWADKNGPFHVNDSLVFKYDQKHAVYLLKDLKTYESCDFVFARIIGGTGDGGDAGFEFTLENTKVHYFACGESGGMHCSQGMKFSLKPTA
ncbi:hypothetical protein ACFE04_023793 [Oxalis oulophora]